MLESCQTWNREYPEKLDVPYWFSGHMVKGQGQTAGLCTNDVHSISFDPFIWKLPNLVWLMPLGSRRPILICHMLKSQGQNAGVFFFTNVVRSNSLDPFAGMLQNLGVSKLGTENASRE